MAHEMLPESEAIWVPVEMAQMVRDVIAAVQRLSRTDIGEGSARVQVRNHQVHRVFEEIAHPPYVSRRAPLRRAQ